MPQFVQVSRRDHRARREPDIELSCIVLINGYCFSREGLTYSVGCVWGAWSIPGGENLGIATAHRINLTYQGGVAKKKNIRTITHA